MKNLSKICLMCLPLLLVSCNKLNCTVSTDSVKTASKMDETNAGTTYSVICFNINPDDGNAKKISKDIFYAKVDDKKVEPKCLLNNLTLKGYYYYYDNEINEVEVKVNKEGVVYKSTSVYVAFEYQSITDNSLFFINDVNIPRGEYVHNVQI